MPRNRYRSGITMPAMARMFVAVVVFVVLIVPFRANALEYYFLGLNHGHGYDKVMQWGSQQMEDMKNQIAQHNPNSTAINTNLSAWKDAESFEKYLVNHMENAASKNQAFYLNMQGHGSPGSTRYINPKNNSGAGMWSGVPMGRAKTLDILNTNGKRLQIPVYVIDHSCGSGQCSAAAKYYINKEGPYGLKGAFSAGHTTSRGYAPSVLRSPWGGSIRGVADLWRNFDALDKDGKGFLTLGEAIDYLRPRTAHETYYSAEGDEGLDTPFIGKECFIGGPRDTCVVVAPGWATEQIPVSIPSEVGGTSYGTCITPPFTNADCPDKNPPHNPMAGASSPFSTTKEESPNYDLYHDQRLNGQILTLKKQYEDAKTIIEQQHKDRYKEELLEDVNIYYVIPDKEQAKQYLESVSERYKVNGISVAPGLYPIGARMNIHPDAKNDEDKWEGVRASETNGVCTFETAEKPPPPPSPDPSTDRGFGGNNSGGSVPSILEGLLSSLFGQGQQQEESVTQDPEQDLSDIDEMPDHIFDCPEEFEPVCAFDGRTYFNECVAEMEAKPVFQEGFCPTEGTDVNNKLSTSLFEHMINALGLIIQKTTTETTLTGETKIP